jgi:hypothetical protein
MLFHRAKKARPIKGAGFFVIPLYFLCYPNLDYHIEYVKNERVELSQRVPERLQKTGRNILKLIAAISATAALQACGEEPKEKKEELGCSPVPDCPTFNIPGESNLYYHRGLFMRENSATGDLYQVCAPNERNLCEDGQTPANDGCELPVCDNAKACDPVPSRKENEFVINLDRANIPTSTLEVLYGHRHFDTPSYPVIYDNVPDCAPGQSSEGSSHFSCDPIPTCEKTFDVCRDLPRCQPGESPITCTEMPGEFLSEQQCLDYLVRSYGHLGQHYLTVYQVKEMCTPEFDPVINQNVYRPPIMEVKCLPVPECQPGERPVSRTLNINFDCGKWGSWISNDTYAPSCDPIKSCTQP